MERLQLVATGLLHLAWRQKYIIVAAILFGLGIAIVITKTADNEIKPVPDHPNDFLIARFDIDEKSHFNDEKTSMFDPGLLEEVRQRWITVKYNASLPYNLQDPNVVDQSMGQAAAINEIFKNMTDGFFIECGAYDGETRSNTLFFERHLNWSGLLIEADPLNFDKMVMKNRRANLSNTCLSTKKYPIIETFLMADNIGRLHKLHSSFAEESELVENRHDVAHHGVHVETQCLPLATYVAALNIKKVDYFSLDIEGLEPEVLKTIPFDLIDIRTLSVEFSHNEKDADYLAEMMDERGYEVVAKITHYNNLANDLIFVKKSFKESLAQ